MVYLNEAVTAHTCPIYMKWVGSSIAVDDPTRRMSGGEVKKGSKLHCRKSNCLGKLQMTQRIVTIKTSKRSENRVKFPENIQKR